MHRPSVNGSWAEGSMRRVRIIAPIAGAAALMLAACAGGVSGQAPSTQSTTPSGGQGSSPGSICGGTIAVLAPLTGGAALAGREQVNFATLAVDDFNAEHGSEYRVIERDTQLDAGQASLQAQAVISDPGVLSALVSSSQEAAAVGPLFASAQMGYLSGSATNPGLTDGRNPTFFRVVPTDAVQGPTVATFIAGLGAKKVAIIEERTDYGKGLARSVEQGLRGSGIEVIRLPVAKDKRAYDDTISRIDRDVDTVFLPFQVAAKAQQFGQTLIKTGRDVTLVASEGQYTPEFSIPGAYVTALAPDIRGVADASGLVERYVSRYGEFSGLGAPSYVAALAVLEAAQRACEASGSSATRAAVLSELPRTRLTDTILGRDITFTEHGDVSGASFSIYRVEPGGRFTRVPAS